MVIFRVIPLLLVTVVLAPAQIVGVELASPQIEKKFEKFLITKQGRKMIVGEIISGLELDLNTWGITKPASAKSVVLAVPDPARPDRPVTTRNRKDELEVKNKKFKVSISEREFKRPDGFHLIYRLETAEGLRLEYERKQAKIDALREEASAHKLGGPEWFKVHRRTLVETDALIAWLRAGLFPQAADKLEKKYEKELKAAGEAASKSRLEVAKNKLTKYPQPDDLGEKLRQFGSGEKFQGHQAQHVRVLAHTTLDGTSGLVLLGERIIEGFRSDFVDPYLAEGDVDPIPEGTFVEFFFGPDDEALQVRIYEEFYGMNFGVHREKAIKLPGWPGRSARGIDYLDFWRLGKGTDPEGVVANAMGKFLANVVYNGSQIYGGPIPAWMSQGFGYWVSFDFIGRNTVTTIDWNTGGYGRSAKKEGVKPIETGMRAAFNATALNSGPALSDLFATTLADMSVPELAKSWSFVDFILTEHADKSRAFFESVCAQKTRDGRVNLEGLRPFIHEIFSFDTDGRDAFVLLDELWREFAARTQLSAKRKRK